MNDAPFSKLSSTCAWVIGWEFTGRVNPAALHRSTPAFPSSGKNSAWRVPLLSQVLFALLTPQRPEVVASPSNLVMHVPFAQPANAANTTAANSNEILAMVSVA